jgi:hypothetical protein
VNTGGDSTDDHSGNAGRFQYIAQGSYGRSEGNE